MHGVSPAFSFYLFCEFGPVFFPAFFVVNRVVEPRDAQAGGAVEFYLEDRRDAGRSLLWEVAQD